MWIMTQGKKGIVNTDETQTIYVTPNALSKKKAAVMAYPSNTALGYYDDEKCAIDELEKLCEAIKNNEIFYEMP